MNTFIEPRLLDATFASIFAMRLLNADAIADAACIAETKARIEANYGRDGLALVNLMMGERLMLAHHRRAAQGMTPDERVRVGREEAEAWARVVRARHDDEDAWRSLRRAIEGYCAVLCAYGIPLSAGAGGGWYRVSPDDDVATWWELSNAARVAGMVGATSGVPAPDVE